ncbi:unnamed protein product [Clonostachys byssicola]|uniref:Uncharacterized protein n=1 Tax=Clonostachys byssicola TaxID=160290 RepID=A0A9N9U6N8_9HYPO|nr:unnamed protein product [Clonostachys byssicola]
MRFSTLAPAFAGLVGIAQATLPNLVGKNTHATCDLAKSWANEVLYKGIAGPKTETTSATSFDLILKEAQVSGDVSLKALDNFLAQPTVRLSLAGIKAYVEIDLSASAAVFQTVELFASGELSVDTELLELDLGAAFALDLIVSASAAIDVYAGFYVSFGAGDYIDISVASKEIVETKLDGLVSKALPVSVGAAVDLSAAIELELGLRLRSHISVGAEVELLDIDLVEAGAEISLWADLCHYTIVLVETAECALSVSNEFILNLGLSVGVNVEALDILDITAAPSVAITIARGEKGIECLPGRIFSNPNTPPKVTATLKLAQPITSGGFVTSETTVTKQYTITSCHASVQNCPASQTQQIVTETVVPTVTVCPISQSGSANISTTTSNPKPVRTITETLTTIVPCEPTTSIYTPPATPAEVVVPTVTITGTTTVCPVTTGVSQTHAPTAPVSQPGSSAISVPITTPINSEPAAPSVTPINPANPGNEAAGPSAPAPSAIHTPAPIVSSPPAGNTPAPGAPGIPGPIPAYPQPNNTLTSVVLASPSNYLPTVVTPTAGNPTVAPPGPSQAGAGSVKVGLALLAPAIVALLA